MKNHSFFNTSIFRKLSTNYPKHTLIVIALLTLLIGSGTLHLFVRNDTVSHLPSEGPIINQIKNIEHFFGEKQIVLIGVESDSIYTTSTLKKITDLTEAVKSVKYILPDQVTSIATVNQINDRDWGLDISTFLDTLPTTSQALIKFREDVENNPLIHGKLISKNGHLALIIANVGEGYNQGELYHKIVDIVSEYEGPEKIYLTGEPILLEDLDKGMFSDINTLVPLSLGLILFGFFFAFRTVKGVVLPFSVVVVSIIWTMGAMGYLGLPLTVVSNALPIIMVAVASSYGIHFMHVYYEKIENGGSIKAVVRDTIDKVGSPILITGLTSALGSASLLVFNIKAMREFGIIAAIGILSATLLTLLFIPAVLSLSKTEKSYLNKTQYIIPFLRRLTTFALTRKTLLIITYVFLLLLSIWGTSQIRVGADFISFFPEDAPSRLTAEVFNDQLNGIRVLDIMIDGQTENQLKDPILFQQISQFQQYLENQEGVGTTHAYTNVVQEIYDTFAEKDKRISLQQPNAIAQYLLLYEMGTEVGELYNLVDDKYQRAKIQVFLTTSEPDHHTQLSEQIQQDFPRFFPDNSAHVSLGGDVMLWVAIIKWIVKGKLQNILLTILFTLGFCTFVFNSWRKGLLALLPISISLLMVFGVMGFLDIRLEISTALFTSMIVGIGIDFAIHYLSRYYDYHSSSISVAEANLQTVATTGKAIWFDVLSNMVGFSVLILSGFLPVRNSGYLIAFAMMLIFLNTILLYPLVLRRS